MAITKEVAIDQITITENGIVLYREVTRIIEDGVQISSAFHRSSIAPGSDLSNVPEQVAVHCRAAWTPEVIAQYQDMSANSLIPPPPN